MHLCLGFYKYTGTDVLSVYHKLFFNISNMFHFIASVSISNTVMLIAS